MVSASWRRPPGPGLARGGGTRPGLEYFWDETSQHETNQTAAAAAMQQNLQSSSKPKFITVCRQQPWSSLTRHCMTRGQALHQGNLGRRPVTPAPGRVAEEGPESGVAGLAGPSFGRTALFCAGSACSLRLGNQGPGTGKGCQSPSSPSRPSGQSRGRQPIGHRVKPRPSGRLMGP